MKLRDSLPEFRELRSFALDEVPRILREEEGSVSKTVLHRGVEDRFAKLRGHWPKELEETGSSGCRRATNAIAWALSELTQRRVIFPCGGAGTVRLRNGGNLPRSNVSPERMISVPEANSRPLFYTTQQIAALKAHVTMARRDLEGLTGEARAQALRKLAEREERLAGALATRQR